MKIVDFINSPGFKKGAGIATIIFAGISAVASAVTDQRKEQEREGLITKVNDLEKEVSELQKK